MFIYTKKNRNDLDFLVKAKNTKNSILRESDFSFKTISSTKPDDFIIKKLNAEDKLFKRFIGENYINQLKNQKEIENKQVLFYSIISQ